MDNTSSRYAQMERLMSVVLLTDTGLFVLYLIFAGIGVIWLKAITAVLAVLISGLSLAYLYITKELLRKRSLWMTAASGAILVCVLFSLLVNYPSASPDRSNKDMSSSTSAVAISDCSL